MHLQKLEIYKIHNVLVLCYVNSPAQISSRNQQLIMLYVLFISVKHFLIVMCYLTHIVLPAIWNEDAIYRIKNNTKYTTSMGESCQVAACVEQWHKWKQYQYYA